MVTKQYVFYKGAWIFKGNPHDSCRLSRKECKTLLNQRKDSLFVRNTYEFDTINESSFWYVIKDLFYGLDEFSPKVRNQIKKSLKTYTVKKISSFEMLEFGYSIFCAAIESYKVKAQAITKADFEKRIKGGKDNTDYWMAFEKESNTPVALSINTVYTESCEYNTMKAIPSYLRNSTYPYYGLIFEMDRYYLEDKKLKYVNDGSRSITEHSGIQPFLIEKFKFRKAYCHLQVYYKWWIRIIVFLLYPFRKLIPIQSIKSVLNMEAMRRNKI